MGDAVVLHLTDAAGVALATARHRLEPEVEACAPGRAIAGKHAARNPWSSPVVGGLDQRLEHRSVHGVHFVAAVEADVSDAVADLDGDAFRHSMLRGRGRRLEPEHAGRHAADRRPGTILHDTRLGANFTAGASLPQPASADAQLGASAGCCVVGGALARDRIQRMDADIDGAGVGMLLKPGFDLIGGAPRDDRIDQPSLRPEMSSVKCASRRSRSPEHGCRTSASGHHRGAGLIGVGGQQAFSSIQASIGAHDVTPLPCALASCCTLSTGGLLRRQLRHFRTQGGEHDRHRSAGATLDGEPSILPDRPS